MATSEKATKEESITEKQTPKPQQPVSEKQTNPEALIYIGPNLPGGLLSSFRIFRDGIPEYLTTMVKDQPKITQLFVPVSGLSEALARASTPGTIEYAAAQDVLHERKGES